MFLIYLAAGALISTKTAPLSWSMALKGQGVGNLPFWIFAYPIPLAAEAIKQVTGEYPSWTPEL